MMEKETLEIGINSVISEIDGVVHKTLNPLFFEVRYQVKGQEYAVEIPKTYANAFLDDGDDVMMLLGIIKTTMPSIDVEKEH